MRATGSDRQRLENLSAEKRRAVDAEVAALEVLRHELTAGVEARDFHAVLVFHEGFDEALHSDGTAHYSVLYDESQEK